MATLQELARRGHRIVVRSGAAEAGLMRSAGIDAGLLAPELAWVEPGDWRARTRFGALMRALNQFGERARPQAADLQQAIGAEQPDAVIFDETSWGAAAAAERSGLPWAFSVSSPVRSGPGTRRRLALAWSRATMSSAACVTGWRRVAG